MPSLIAIFSQFKVGIPPGVSFPPNAVAPKEWSMFFLWDCNTEEIDREFQQIFEIVSPDGNQLAPPQIITFTPTTDKLRQNVIANAQAIPIGVPGIISVRTRLEQNGAVIIPEATYSFDVQHVPAS
jgi:hypothetical protein